jgi:hypothetical protein
MKNLNLQEACSIVGDALGLRMALDSIRETMSSLMPLRNYLTLLRAKLPWLRITRVTFLYRVGYPEHKIRRIHSRMSHSGSHHAFMYKSEESSSRQSTHNKLPKRKNPIASNEPIISFKTFDASYVLTNKSGKVVAKYVGAKHKGSKTCF